MAELPPEMARLLEDARRAHEPSAADCERVRRSLYTALGAPSALGHTGASEGAAASTSSGALSSLTGTTGGKLLLVAALMGGAGGVWTWSSRVQRQPAISTSVAERAPAPSVTPLPQSPIEPAPAQVARRPERAAPLAAAPVVPAIEARAERPASVVRSQREARAARVTAARARVREPVVEQELPAAPAVRASEPARAAEHLTSARVPASTEAPREIVKEESEVTLIRAALASLNAHEPQRTLELLEAHAARYPLGAMGRERAGLRVLALCDVGRLQEGRREQAAFLQAASDSPLQNRVRRACATGAETGARDGREPQ